MTSSCGKQLINQYKQSVCLDDRKEKSAVLMEKKKKTVPIMAYPNYKDMPSAKSTVQQTKEDGTVVDVEKPMVKFIIKTDKTFSEFMHSIRKYMKGLDPSEALFFLTETGIMIPASWTVEKVYNAYKDEDGFLYLVYSRENTFG